MNDDKQSMAPIVTARRKLRDDAGPTDKLSEPEQFVVLDGCYYPVDWIKTAPGLLAQQVEVCDG